MGTVSFTSKSQIEKVGTCTVSNRPFFYQVLYVVTFLLHWYEGLIIVKVVLYFCDDEGHFLFINFT